MKISRPQNSRSGVALIVVMVAIFVLTMMAAAFAFSMKVETKLAQNAGSEEQLLWLGRSGVEYARWILANHPPGEPYDSLNQIWAGGPGSPGETNSVLSTVSLDNYPVGNGTVSVKIIDLERFANINTAGDAELQQALTLMGVGADSISVVSDSILDWVQAGDVPRVAGAKNDYYQGLNPPYYCKEAPMDDLSELLLVQGVTPAMYYGGTEPGQAPSPFHHRLGFANSPDQPPDYPFGLKDLFTPFSTGKINLNTADTNVLQLIPGVDGAVAEPSSSNAPGRTAWTARKTTYRLTPPTCKPLGDNNPLAASLVTTRSSTFRAHRHRANRRRQTPSSTAILYRGGPEIQVVGFYWK